MSPLLQQMETGGADGEDQRPSGGAVVVLTHLQVVVYLLTFSFIFSSFVFVGFRILPHTGDPRRGFYKIPVAKVQISEQKTAVVQFVIIPFKPCQRLLLRFLYPSLSW